MKCPSCTNIKCRKSGIGKGKNKPQRYRCQKCEKTFQIVYIYTFQSADAAVRCRRCDSTNYHKTGITKGQKRYRCLDCRKTFQGEYKN